MVFICYGHNTCWSAIPHRSPIQTSITIHLRQVINATSTATGCVLDILVLTVVYFSYKTVIFYWCLMLPSLSARIYELLKVFCLLQFVWNQFGISCIKSRAGLLKEMSSRPCRLTNLYRLTFDSAGRPVISSSKHCGEMSLFGMWRGG